MTGDILKRLQSWYDAQCDGEWEEQYGVRIDTLDNPGWIVHIDLDGTSLEQVTFQPVNDLTDSADWINCRVREGKFEGQAGPLGLTRILSTFLDWAEAAQTALM